MKSLLHTLLLLLLAIPSFNIQAQSLYLPETPSPKREVRAVWLTTLSGLDWPKTKAISAQNRQKQQEELCQILDQLQACHINTVMLQTRIRGSVIYPSQIEPWDVALTGQFDKGPGYDPLAFAIEETHRRGMELHAWVVTIPSFKIAVAGKMGKRSLLKTHPKLLKKHGDTYYLNPADKASADYLTKICQEIVSKYDVDGIHFDYIRYPENAASFPDAADYKKYVASLKKGEKAITREEWRRQNITRIVQQTHQAIKELKPWVRLSCSPVGKFRDVSRFSARGWAAYSTVFQDAQGWLREGVMDMLLPMMYFTGDHFYPFATDWQEHAYGRTVAPGLGIYFLHPKEKDWDWGVIQRELCYIRQEGLHGQAYFRSQFLTDNTKGIYDFLQQTFYPYAALLPAMTWQDSIPPLPPTIVERKRVGGTAERITWQPQEQKAGGLRYAIYASPNSPVDTSRTENLVCLTRDCSYTYNLLSCTLYGLHLAITAIDRYGNESEAVEL